MHVVVDHSGVRLDRPEEFDRFDVRRRGEIDLAAVLGEHRWGLVTVDGDVLVRIDALRAAGPDDETWRHGLDGMLAYAATKGWVDETGEHVQAHVVDEDNPEL